MTSLKLRKIQPGNKLDKPGVKFTLRDALAEAVLGLSGRPGRFLLSVTATMLGIGLLVATIGFAQTGSQQIATRFDEISATQAVIKVAEPDTNSITSMMPWDADRTVKRLNGVKNAGLITILDPQTLGTITAAPVFDPMEPPVRQPGVIATTEGLLETVQGTILEGEYFNSYHQEHAERVAVLGKNAAELLQITRVDNQPTVFIGKTPFVVIGIADGMERRQELLEAIIIPQSAAKRYLQIQNPGELQIQISLGAGNLLNEQAPYALNPESPQDFEVIAPPPTSNFRENLSSDINSLFLIIGVVALFIGGLSVAVVTSMSVMERKGEIGLRRALGATKIQIASQFILETIIIGILGGLIGAALGMFGVIIAAIWNQWTPILDTTTCATATLLGAIIGLLSGITPATRAANLEPANALQEGTG